MKIENKTFLLTGGAGLIGPHLCQLLIAKGAKEVRIYDNFSFSQPETINELKKYNQIKLINGDVYRLDNLVDALEGVDGAFSLAACMSRYTHQDPLRTININLQGHNNLLKACTLQKVKKVVFSSSTGVYGYKIVGEVTEDFPLDSIDVSDAAVIYGASKLIGEKLCSHYQKKHGLEYVALRYSTVYGEWMHDRAANAFYILGNLDRLIAGKKPILYDKGEETKDYVYAGDVANANALAMGSDVNAESFNISGQRKITVKDLTHKIMTILDLHSDIDFREKSDDVRLVSPAPFVYNCYKASKLLNWTPKVLLDEGLERTIQWRKDYPGTSFGDV